jgi:hypothetical protein
VRIARKVRFMDFRAPFGSRSVKFNLGTGGRTWEKTLKGAVIKGIQKGKSNLCLSFERAFFHYFRV